MYKWLLIGLSVWWCVSGTQAWTIMSYNVENLFDYHKDSLKNDDEFTPGGVRHWTYARYQTKVEQIARVICAVGENEMPAIVGLCEVENDYCLRGLCYPLRRYPYRSIHFESPDERGVDVALLYNPRTFCVLDSMALAVDLGEDKTRDILYVSGVMDGSDTLHVFVCHLPSMLGGKATSEWKRQTAKRVILNKVNDILEIQPNAKMVVMGDMNDAPHEDIPGMNNLMIPLERQGMGSHRYHGIWTCLDQFYVSDALVQQCQADIYNAPFLLEDDNKYLGVKPKRTFIGYQYHADGFSDHLPILLTTND